MVVHQIWHPSGFQWFPLSVIANESGLLNVFISKRIPSHIQHITKIDLQTYEQFLIISAYESLVFICIYIYKIALFTLCKYRAVGWYLLNENHPKYRSDTIGTYILLYN